MPDAQQLKEQLTELTRSAVELAPEPTFLDKLQLPPQPAERRRPSFDRLLDASTTHEDFASLKALMEPAHDYVIAVLQTWLDRIKGHAFPLEADNKRLTTEIAECTDRYSTHLFFEWKGEVLEVRVRSKSAIPSQQSNPEGPAALAGNFAVSTYMVEQKAQTILTTLALFPQLIAARSIEHAKALLETRRQKSSE